jgi:16S rRNA A1518/A1519 N6-dimethyltransferase RsmA/KsgA/DIM1 with predicted DNA glycosylase/AP lyase activity
MRRVLRSLLRIDAESAERLLATVGIAPEARPETISPAGFAALLRAAKG